MAHLSDQRVRWEHRQLLCKNFALLCVKQSRLRKSNLVYQRVVCTIVSGAVGREKPSGELRSELLDRAAKTIWKFAQVDFYEALRHTRICQPLATEAQLARRPSASGAQEPTCLPRKSSNGGDSKDKDHLRDLVRLYLPAESRIFFKAAFNRHFKDRARTDHELRIVCSSLAFEEEELPSSFSSAMKRLGALYTRSPFAVPARLKELGLSQEVMGALRGGEFVVVSHEDQRVRAQLSRAEPEQIALFGSSSTFRVCIELLFVAAFADRRFGSREELLATFMRANFLICDPILQLSTQRILFATNYARYITGAGLSVRPRERNDAGVLADLEQVFNPSEEDPCTEHWRTFFAEVEAARRVDLTEMVAKWNQRMPKTHILRSLEFFARLSAEMPVPAPSCEFSTPRLGIFNAPRRPLERSPLDDSVRASKLFAARLAAAVYAGASI